MDRKLDDASSAMRATKLLCVLDILPQVAHGVLEDVYMIIFKNEHADKTNDVNSTVPSGHHKVKSSSVSKYLRNCFAKLKASFSKAVISLDMFNDYLEAPSEKTINSLETMFYRKKEDSDELHLVEHDLDEILDHLQAVSDYFTPHSEKESKKSSHSDSRSFEKMSALKNEVHSLKVENQELLAELGQVMVEKAAKEREERKSEFFQQIYRPSLTKAKQSVVSTSNDEATTEDDTLGYPDDNDTTLRESFYANENASSSNRFATDFSKAEAINENADLTSLVSTAVSSKKAVQGVASLVKETDHRPEKEQHVKNDKAISTDNNENKNPTTQNLPSVTSKKTASSGEAVDQSGNVTGASNASSISRGENIEQSSTLQSYDSLSFSVQQDYSNEKEKISPSNVPPTSEATTLYNNYKLLLLSLGQMLLSSDVTKLMTWATQNFPIVNPQNAIHVLFQLDENEVINASDLSQLRHFFESIVRFDLVYVIDAFLLGDYGILRQITSSKKRDVNTQQTSQTGTTTRYQNLFNAASNSQFSLRNSSLRGENSNEPQSSVLQQKQQAFPPLVLNQPAPNDAKFVPRSPNENHSTAYGLQSLKSGAMGFTASQQVVADGHVTSKLHYCFVRHDIHEKEISYQVAINAKKDYYILQAKNLVNAYVLFNYLFYVFIEFKYFSRLVL